MGFPQDRFLRSHRERILDPKAAVDDLSSLRIPGVQERTAGLKAEPAFDRQLGDLSHLASARAAMASLAEQYVGLPQEVPLESARDQRTAFSPRLVSIYLPTLCAGTIPGIFTWIV